MEIVNRVGSRLRWLVIVLSALAFGAQAQTNAPIPWEQLGAKAGADYHGDGLAVTPTAAGARLHCIFQRMDGEVTREGLWLTSTVTNQAAESFRVLATAIGSQALPAQGEVTLDRQTVKLLRPGLVEEYSVSMDGVRQDFVVTDKPANSIGLRVHLTVAGARVAHSPQGATLTLDRSGRKIAYSRLKATDAKGRTLTATMEVTDKAEPTLAIAVDDTDAVYPIRIDPTFSDANWVSIVGGGSPGTDGQIYAIVSDNAGNVYIGGKFTAVCTATANNIAKWNGSSWSALGSGLIDGASPPAHILNYTRGVYALAVDGSGNVYAGGSFTMAGEVAANGIAKWNGSSWSALGSGMTFAEYWRRAYVSVLALDGSGNLYAGGYFESAGGVAARSIAKWNGSSWSPLGSGMSITPYSDGFNTGTVLALALAGNGDVYAGGYFDSAGGVAASSIAKWDGNGWSPLGSGLTGAVYPNTAIVRALTFDGNGNGYLYAGGNFTTAGGVAATSVAKWNGISWSTVGSGFYGLDQNLGVFALAVDASGNVYVGGYLGRQATQL